MKAYELIEKLQSEIENTSTVPLLSNKIMLEKNEILDMIEEIKIAIPDEIKEARKIIEDEARIKQQAKRRADGMIDEARAQKQHLIDSNTITKNANDEAEAIIAAAKSEANKLKLRSIEYVTNLLGKAQTDLGKAQNSLKSIIGTIETNKAELNERKKPATTQRNPKE